MTKFSALYLCMSWISVYFEKFCIRLFYPRSCSTQNVYDSVKLANLQWNFFMQRHCAIFVLIFLRGRTELPCMKSVQLIHGFSFPRYLTQTYLFSSVLSISLINPKGFIFSGLLRLECFCSVALLELRHTTATQPPPFSLQNKFSRRARAAANHFQYGFPVLPFWIPGH